MARVIDWSGDYTNGWAMHLIFVAATITLYLRLDPKRYVTAMYGVDTND